MTKEEFRREKLYLATMHFAKKLLADGAITKGSYYRFDTKMRAKYRPKIGTLLSGKSLIEAKVRALMDVGKEAENGKCEENPEAADACDAPIEEGCGIRQGVKSK